ncbi:hypothetical protein PMAYCL1PPCAC_30669, partial [Pristionchus mayeri]
KERGMTICGLAESSERQSISRSRKQRILMLERTDALIYATSMKNAWPICTSLTGINAFSVRTMSKLLEWTAIIIMSGSSSIRRARPLVTSMNVPLEGK